MLTSGHGHVHSTVGLLLASLVCGILAQCPDLKVMDDYFPLKTDMICIKLYKTPDCTKFAKSYDKKDLPADYPRSESGTDKPEDFRLYNSKYVVQDSARPAIELAWNSPSSVAARNRLQGFLIVWHYRTSNAILCNLLLFNTSAEIIKKRLNFEYKLRVEEKSVYTVELHSMPTHSNLTSDRFEARVILTPSIYTINHEEMDPAEWYPYLTGRTFQNGTLIIWFTLPPAKFRLTRFLLMLFDRNDEDTVLQEADLRPPPISATNTHGRHVFQVNKTGCYNVLVRVREEEGNRLEPGKCSCFIKLLAKRRCQPSCGSVVGTICINVTGSTEKPDISPLESATEPGAAKPPYDTSMKEAIVVGFISAILFLMFIFCIALCLKLAPSVSGKQSHRKGSINHSNVNNSWSDSDPAKGPGVPVVPLTEKLVYIIYALDHQPHVKLVDAFIAFLNVHCRCSLIYLMPCECDEFLTRISSADYVIFLDSRGAESLIEAYLNIRMGRIKPSSVGDDLFQLGVKYLMQSESVRENKLILVSFNRNYCQKYLQVSVVYTLPKDLLGFLQKLHHLNEESTKAYDNLLPLHVENIPNLPEGARLMTAIKAVEDFEVIYPRWFEKKFGLLKSLSEDAGYSSDATSSTSPVSIQGLPANECDSPVSALEELDDPHDPTGTQSPPYMASCTDSRSCYPKHEFSETALSVVSGKLNVDGISDTFTLCQPHKLPKELEHDHLAIKPLDDKSLIPPETVSEIRYDTYSNALAQINLHGEVLPLIVQSQTDCVGNVSNVEPVLESMEFTHMNKLKQTAPETLSNKGE